MDYRYGSHTVYQIEYHFVWVTKRSIGSESLIPANRARFKGTRPLEQGVLMRGGHKIVTTRRHSVKAVWCYNLVQEVPFMSDLSKRSTVYFEPDIHHALRVMAANTHQSVSEFVNEAVRMALREDQEDLSAFEERAAEPTLTYEELLEDLKSHGRL